jgi:uncharacterized repeat protein (TIGR02543 family)
MTKKIAAYFICLSLVLVTFIGCEDIATLIHGVKPEEKTPPPVTYTVTYNANGGTGSVPSPQTVNAGASITVGSGSSLSKSGYTFSGWNTTANGTGTNYADGASFVVNASSILYAKWVNNAPTTYTITYNANGGSGSVPTSQTVNEGTSITVGSGSGLSKSGYTFSGWNTAIDGSGISYAVVNNRRKLHPQK